MRLFHLNQFFIICNTQFWCTRKIYLWARNKVIFYVYIAIIYAIRGSFIVLLYILLERNDVFVKENWGSKASHIYGKHKRCTLWCEYRIMINKILFIRTWFYLLYDTQRFPYDPDTTTIYRAYNYKPQHHIRNTQREEGIWVSFRPYGF